MFHPITSLPFQILSTPPQPIVPSSTTPSGLLVLVGEAVGCVTNFWGGGCKIAFNDMQHDLWKPVYNKIALLEFGWGVYCCAWYAPVSCSILLLISQHTFLLGLVQCRFSKTQCWLKNLLYPSIKICFPWKQCMLFFKKMASLERCGKTWLCTTCNTSLELVLAHHYTSDTP